jgi:hypothetical protein
MSDEILVGRDFSEIRTDSRFDFVVASHVIPVMYELNFSFIL